MSSTQLQMNANLNAGHMMGSGAFASDMAQRRPLAMQKKMNQNYQRYMDKMDEALNKCIDKNIFPHWRNHQSLKGKLDFSSFKAGAP